MVVPDLALRWSVPPRAICKTYQWRIKKAGRIPLPFCHYGDLTVDAVLRNLEIVGEASRNIPPEIRSGYPDIPWGRMMGLRNIVSHEYFGIDLSIIWQIITVNLPETKPLIEKMIQDSGED